MQDEVRNNVGNIGNINDYINLLMINFLIKILNLKTLLVKKKGVLAYFQLFLKFKDTML